MFISGVLVYLFKLPKVKSFTKMKMHKINLQNKLIFIFIGTYSANIKRVFLFIVSQEKPFAFPILYVLFLLKLKYTCQYHIFMFMISKRVSETITFSKKKQCIICHHLKAYLLLFINFI